MPDIRKRVTQDNPLVMATQVDDNQCAYTSPTFGRCRYYGTIHTPSGAPGLCYGHYRHEHGPEAEQVAEASTRWRRTVYDRQANLVHEDDGSPAVDSIGLEERAREVARRFGVDENLSPKDRCLEIARRLGVKLPMREPGCDEE